jgi:nicotinamidase-related amidase
MDKFFIDRYETALLIVDVQEKLAAVMNMKDTVTDNCLHLIELSKLIRLPVLVTEQYPKGLGSTVEKIKKALPDCQPLEKLHFSCCDQPSFSDEIRRLNRKNILLTGMETHICILQTCIGLLRDGHNVHLVKDAVCSRTKENWRTACEFMRDAGAVITCTEAVIFQLLKVAGTEEFRVISKRIK